MSGNRYDPPSTLMSGTYHAIEEMNELTRAVGREGEFRQLSRGQITSQWRSLHLGQFALTSHRFDKRIQARLSPPKGCVSLAILPPPHFMSVSGVEFGSDMVLVTDTNSNFDLVTPDKFAGYTLVLPECDFEETGQALFPGFRMRKSGGLTRLMKCPSSGLSALRGDMGDLLRNGSLSPEDFSHLLSQLLDLMAGEPEKHQREVCLGIGSAGIIARRAQEYIEDHYSHTIRMEDICSYAGMSMSTVHRSFSEYFQMSPFEYVKACRLDAARRTLLDNGSSRDKVTGIALDSGFTHLGRFSTDYRRHFDESPKQTLALRKRGPGVPAEQQAAFQA